MPRPAQTGVGGPGVRTAAWRVSPWQSARRGPAAEGGSAGRAGAEQPMPAAAASDSGQSDADLPDRPAVSGGSSADEEPVSAWTVTLSGPAFLAYYAPGVYPPPVPGVLADPPAGEPAVVGRLDGPAHHAVWAVGSVLPDAATAGLPADCSFSAGDRLLALGLYGPAGRGGHATALLAQASGGDAASLTSPPPDGPRGREARAILCGVGTVPARGPAPRLRFECETLLDGPDAAAFLSATAPALLTDPPPRINTGAFSLRGWKEELEGGEAGGPAPPPPPPPRRPSQPQPGDPDFDADLDGGVEE